MTPNGGIISIRRLPLHEESSGLGSQGFEGFVRSVDCGFPAMNFKSGVSCAVQPSG